MGDYESRIDGAAFAKRLSGALDEWRHERAEWLDRTVRFLLFVNAGGLALTATYAVAVVEDGVPMVAGAAILIFLAGIVTVGVQNIARLVRAERGLREIAGIAEDVWELGMPPEIVGHPKYPKETRAMSSLWAIGVSIGCFIVGASLSLFAILASAT